MKNLIATCIALCAASTVQAATFVYDLTVTTSQDLNPPPSFVPAFDLPVVGTTGTVTVTLNDTVFGGSTAIPDEFTDITSLLSVTAAFGDLTASLEAPSILPSATEGFFRLSNGSFSSLPISTSQAADSITLAGGFRFTAPPLIGPPATLSDISAILGNARTKLEFSFNGDINGEPVEFSAAGALQNTTAVPLPAGGLLLLSGLGAFALRRRSQRL
jgi:hypothetical protein